MTKYVIDQTHSDISFSVKHMVISSVKGWFNNYEATLNAQKEDFSDANFKYTIDVNSLYTGNTERDTHLKSSSLFNVNTFPQIVFQSKDSSIVDDDFIVSGTLQIRDHIRDVVLKGKYTGMTIDTCGQEKYCFRFKSEVKRYSWFLDFISTNSKTVLIDNNVELNLELEFFK